MTHDEGPTFLILGAQKAGTTWFARMLGRQAGVFIPERKEVHFLTRHYGNGHAWYDAQFAAARASGFAIRGEATPNYLGVTYPEYAEVADRIARYRRDLRFVVLLRNPIDRALSAYFHHVTRGRFSPLERFETHLAAMLAGRDAFGILEFGRYGAQLDYYLGLFDRAQFHVLFYEELSPGRVQGALADTLRFLGASADPVGPFDERLNVSPRSRGAARLGSLLSFWMRDDITRIRFGGITANLARTADMLGRRVELEVEARRQLADHYREDAALLSSLLGRPLSAWPDFEARLVPASSTHGQTLSP
jgi:hypothetical protein